MTRLIVRRTIKPTEPLRQVFWPHYSNTDTAILKPTIVQNIEIRYIPLWGVILMATFLGMHKMPDGMDETAITKSWEDYKASATEMGLTPIEAVVSKEKGVAYCQTEADSADQVRQAHEKASVPLEDVVEVKKLS